MTSAGSPARHLKCFSFYGPSDGVVFPIVQLDNRDPVGTRVRKLVTHVSSFPRKRINAVYARLMGFMCAGCTRKPFLEGAIRAAVLLHCSTVPDSKAIHHRFCDFDGLLHGRTSSSASKLLGKTRSKFPSAGPVFCSPSLCCTTSLGTKTSLSTTHNAERSDLRGAAYESSETANGTNN